MMTINAAKYVEIIQLYIFWYIYVDQSLVCFIVLKILVLLLLPIVIF